MAAARGLLNQHTAVGALYVVCGLLFGGAASRYPIGTGRAMGAGYFPLGLSAILVLLGLIVVLRGSRANRPAAPLQAWDWRGLAWIVGATVAFAVTLAPLGLPLAIVLLVVLASQASHAFDWRTTLLNGGVLAAINVGVFAGVLRLPLPLLPVWLNG